MNVPNGYDDATDEMKRAYLVGNKSSQEIAGMIRALLEYDRNTSHETPALNKEEKAEIYIRLYDQINDE